MADVTVIAKPNPTENALRSRSPRIGWAIMPEFRDYFARIFDLDRVGLPSRGSFRRLRDSTYALVFIGRSGEPFPSGVEVYAVVDALEPIDDSVLDADLWAILGWMIEGVGAPWTRHDLEETGRLYRIPAAVAGSDR